MTKELLFWKSAKTSMPDSDITVLVFAPFANDPVWLGYHDGEVWREVGSDTIDGRVTHWAQLPLGPGHTSSAKDAMKADEAEWEQRVKRLRGCSP